MIHYETGDILRADAEALVNTVNCVGIMGRGIALRFKQAFPENFRVYAAACKRDEVQPGRMFVFETRSMTNPKYIINFPTKRHWRGKSRIEDIDVGLQSLVAEVRARGIRSIAVPPLGSGLGGLNWADVRPRIEAALSDLNIRVTVFEPHPTAEAQPTKGASKVPQMTEGRAALVGLMRRYLSALLDPFVTLLEVHKLMYFMQEAGQPLRLRYVQGLYGPYAENLRHVLREIDGYFISGYSDGSDRPEKEIELVPGAVNEAEAFLANHAETDRRFERVADLVEGFETPFGLELLSTVHWVVTRENVRTEDEIAARVYAWNERKRQFTRRQIVLARKILLTKGWIAVA